MRWPGRDPHRVCHRPHTPEDSGAEIANNPPPTLRLQGFTMEKLFIELLVSWGPMLLLIGVWLFFMRRMRGTQQKQQDYMAAVNGYVTEHLAETRRLNQNLERIANALERRQP